MWWWRKVTYAKLEPELRKRFEIYGENVIAQAVANPDIGMGAGDLPALIRSNYALALDWLGVSRPAREAIVDRRRRPVGFGAIRPSAAAFQHMNDAADDAAIVRSLLATRLLRQMRFNALPLLVAQPEQVPAHDPNPSPRRISIVLSGKKD